VVVVNAGQGFVNGGVYEHWLTEVILPYVRETRQRLGYRGPAVIIQDGCSAHRLGTGFLEAHTSEFVFVELPAHSSHLTQPLDLGVFGIQKGVKATMSAPDRLKILDKQSLSLIKIVNSLFKAATPTNIISAFHAAGIMNNFGQRDGRDWMFPRVDITAAKKVYRYILERERGVPPGKATAAASVDEEVLEDVLHEPDPLSDVVIMASSDELSGSEPNLRKRPALSAAFLPLGNKTAVGETSDTTEVSSEETVPTPTARSLTYPARKRARIQTFPSRGRTRGRGRSGMCGRGRRRGRVAVEAGESSDAEEP